MKNLSTCITWALRFNSGTPASPHEMKANYAFDFPSYRSQKFRHSLHRTWKEPNFEQQNQADLGANVKTQAFSLREYKKSQVSSREKQASPIDCFLNLSQKKKNINNSKTHLVFSEAKVDLYTVCEREVGFGVK